MHDEELNKQKFQTLTRFVSEIAGVRRQLNERKEKRLEEENEITISVIGGGENLPIEKIISTLSKDISASGARIQSNSFLPVDTPLKIKVMLKNPLQIITVFGKVKWIRSRSGDSFYEAGVEFFNTPDGEINKLAEYISSKS
ncbi:MAG TPA: PilZ domain-containing protein [Smithellaceae bacterium]|nr:PilZ domain-containing protein [Smithellaceae bacterium]